MNCIFYPHGANFLFPPLNNGFYLLCQFVFFDLPVSKIPFAPKTRFLGGGGGGGAEGLTVGQTMAGFGGGGGGGGGWLEAAVSS